jgi:hypothetical protein
VSEVHVEGEEFVGDEGRGHPGEFEQRVLLALVRLRLAAPARASEEGSGSFVNEACAELPEWPKVARLGQRPLFGDRRA